jgi:hypothetical protein
LGITTAWLTGTQKAKERRAMLALIESGEAQLVVGTHAIIQDKVKFKNLALAIIDEQHRFGVAQRLALRNKLHHEDMEPHLLMMTATPIPRTLAMSYYADLDVSTLDELPPGRTPIVTKVVNDARRDEVIERIRAQIIKHHRDLLAQKFQRHGQHAMHAKGVLRRQRRNRRHAKGAERGHGLQVRLNAGAAAGIRPGDDQHTPLHAARASALIRSARRLTTPSTRASSSASAMTRMTGSVPLARISTRPRAPSADQSATGLPGSRIGRSGGGGVWAAFITMDSIV